MRALKLRYLLSAVLLTTLLTGCRTEPSEPVLRSHCPVLVKYDKEFMRLAAEALRNLPLDSPVNILMNDYLKLRDICRAIGQRP